MYLLLQPAANADHHPLRFLLAAYKCPFTSLHAAMTRVSSTRLDLIPIIVIDQS